MQLVNRFQIYRSNKTNVKMHILKVFTGLIRWVQHKMESYGERRFLYLKIDILITGSKLFSIIILKNWRRNHFQMLYLVVNIKNNKDILLVRRCNKLLNLLIMFQLSIIFSFILKVRCRLNKCTIWRLSRCLPKLEVCLTLSLHSSSSLGGTLCLSLS